MKRWKIAGINFDHMHMGDLLRQALAHEQVELVGVSDERPERVWPVLEQLHLPREQFVADYRQLMEQKRPDVVILCPATAEHGKWTELVAPFGPHIMIEKPFAASLSEADRMIDAMKRTGRTLAINWPLRWYPSHVTAKRLCDEGVIGDILEVHYYDGNRGPMYHVMDKIEVSPEQVTREKSRSWFYQKDRGGGSLLDYLGYGVTLGTWYLNGGSPTEVTCVVDQPHGLEVDEHAVVICRYKTGLSKYETRWGAFTDPWTTQPQPKCGFVLVGAAGTISSYDYESTIRIQTKQRPQSYELAVDQLKPPMDGPINYLLHCLEAGVPVEGPLSPTVARVGQQIVDSAILSAREKRMVSLLK